MRRETHAIDLKARAFEKECLDLRIGGATYTQMEEKTGHTRSACCKAVHRALRREKKEISESAQHLKDIMRKRLESLIITFYINAKNGDLKSAYFLLALSKQLAELDGLEEPKELTIKMGFADAVRKAWDKRRGQ
jgi:hypothetical protein